MSKNHTENNEWLRSHLTAAFENFKNEIFGGLGLESGNAVMEHRVPVPKPKSNKADRISHYKELLSTRPVTNRIK